MTNVFVEIANSIIVLHQRGVYKQTTAFERKGEIYAKHGSGFIGLRRNNGTTVSTIRWEHIENVDFYFASLGVMIKKD